MKTCIVCKKEKQLKYFTKSCNRKNGIRNHCRDCHNLYSKNYYKNNKEKAKESRLNWRKNNPEKTSIIRMKSYYKSTFNISFNEVQNMKIKQGGKCAICEIIPKRRLVLDHNHKTNKLRKLLCDKCNSILGYSNENKNILNNCIKYLEKYE